MCRHLAYLGVPSSPAWPMFDAPHSLLVQSYAPKDMRAGGTVNADGFGLGWFADDGGATYYRRPLPLWADEALPRLASTVRSPSFLAAARSSTPGMPVCEGACAPFRADGWLFSHNGVVRGWPESVAGLAEKLPVTDLLRLEAPTDSALLWALLLDRLRGGTDPVAAVLELTLEVEAAAPGSRLNLVLTDGDLLVATAWTHALSVLAKPEGVLLASEPVDDDPAWRTVPDGHVVVVRRDTPARVEPRPIKAGPGRTGPIETERRQA